MNSWQPNLNAKPFTPSSAFFTLPVPCKKIRIRKKGIFSRIIQWLLVIVLLVTVVINFIFIWDTTKKYSRDRTNSNTAEGISKLEQSKEKTGMFYFLPIVLFTEMLSIIGGVSTGIKDSETQARWIKLSDII